MYTVCGYDKDNDIYEIYLDTNNFDDAKQLAEVLSNLVLMVVCIDITVMARKNR